MAGLLADVVQVALRVRMQRPLIHYIPNWVTANDAANALLAFGASPIMALAPEEVADIRSAALALNLGTPTCDRYTTMELAGRAASTRNVPIVVDPVGAGATPFRLEHAQQLLAALPVAIVRLNVSEAAALLGEQTLAPGVDAVAPSMDSSGLAQAFAQRYTCVAAISGAADVVSDGRRTLLIQNGTPLLARITGTGCMVSGIVAACAAVDHDHVLAAAAALLAFGVAGEMASDAPGPGSLRVGLLDALANLDETVLLERGKVQWI
ncbi:MAG: hydroxyethylthiazole kinase [Chloroflexota bacterium]|nr:hydroxyethylthiazole kinase [Chloroflexota bacterium]PLS77144.1 MAG: hydroxyethylthiazole kinase [Chloroflexota bacterium]